MFYVVKYTDLIGGGKCVEIRTAPAKTNLSHEPRVQGWCGTSDGISVFAHGEYPTLTDAREAARRVMKETETHVFKCDNIAAGICDDVEAAISDDQIAEVFMILAQER